MSCTGKISSGIVNSCDTESLPIGGVKVKAWIMNTDDIDIGGLTYEATNDLVITAMSMLTGKVAYEIEVLEDTIDGNTEMVSQDFGPNYHKHSIHMVVTDWKNANKMVIKEWSNSKVTVILENQKSNDAQFEVYGLNSGLKMATGKRNTKDLKASYDAVLASKDSQEEPNLPYSVWSTDYATSLAIVEALATV